MREQNETTTPQEVWQLLRELIEMQKESERRLQETERVLKESSQETERVLKESGQETERRLQETERVLKESGQETERRLQETERLLKESSQRVDAQMGKWGNRLGEFVEWQVRPAAVRLFQERGIDVTELQSNISVDRGAEEGMEIDLLAVNGTQAVAVEVKSKLTQQDVDEHLERLAKFKRLLPRYQTMNILGAVAAFVIPPDVARYAYRNGLFVIAQSGQNLVILNDSKFRPKAW
ncbi:MAG: hypothetical protein KGS73_11305 [Chloroflexi bacterium]|nr:hypothetical protein [Chloroflexota bacterium]